MSVAAVAKNPHDDEDRDHDGSADQDVAGKPSQRIEAGVPKIQDRVTDAIPDVERRPSEDVHDVAHDKRHKQQFDEYTPGRVAQDRKSTRLNSSHVKISYAVFCLKKKRKTK